MPEPKKKTKNYFNEEEATRWIVEYQRTAIREINSEGVETVVWKDVVLEEKIMVEVIKIVRAIIHVYRYYVFEDYDDCLQHANMSCYQNFMKWNKEKGTAFNFFSIISKRSLLNYTDRRKKHRNHSDIQDHLDIYDNKTMNFDFYLEEVRDHLVEIVDRNFIGAKRKRFVEIANILIEYLSDTKKFVSKTDFYSFAKAYKKRSIEIREFVKAMKEHGSELFGDAESV